MFERNGLCDAVVTAAGSSTRMGAGRKKEHEPLDGRPVLVHAVRAFLVCGFVRTVVVTCRPGERENVGRLLSDHVPTAAVRLVDGGTTRQESVYNALRALEDTPPGVVLIHDGSRPWVTGAVIAAVYETTRRRGACIPVVRPTDALKRLDSDGAIAEHLDRETIAGAQTPQGFRYPDILEAHRAARELGRTCADDSEVWELTGRRTFTVPGDPANRKVTYAHDLGASATHAGGTTS